MNPDILLSFILPAYNVENTLSRCIDSIINQSVKNFEIIIVNDGCKDNSQVIIDKYVLAYPDYIKAYAKENGGPGDARNYGIKRSGGRYVAFVDSDDFIEPGYTKVVTDLIDEHDPDMVIISYNRIHNKKQNFLEKNYKFSKWDVYNKPINLDVKPEIICNIEGASWLKIVKKELFFKDDFLFFTQSSIAEDLEASLKWYLNAGKIIVINDKLYNYVVAPNTLNWNNKSIEQFIAIIDSVCGYYERLGKFRDCYHELEYVFAKQMLISNIRRLMASKQKNNFEILMSLRASLLHYFPRYNKNKYFKSDPLYLRIAVMISWYFPEMFYPLLSPL
jgi:glycosyltransferase involved in cell wall biosynthesis